MLAMVLSCGGCAADSSSGPADGTGTDEEIADTSVAPAAEVVADDTQGPGEGVQDADSSESLNGPDGVDDTPLDSVPDAADSSEVSSDVSVTWVPVVTEKPAQCATGELLFAPADATTATADALFDAIAAEFSEICGSVGDVDGDGRTDLLVGDRLLLNCGDDGFVDVGLPGVEATYVVASAITDLEADGVREILLGDSAGQLHLRRLRADGTFDVEPPVRVVAEDAMITGISPLPDRDGDGAPDLLYVTAYAWPPLLFAGGFPNTVLFAAENKRYNALLFVGGDGSLTKIPMADPARDCGHAPSYAAVVGTRHHLGLSDVMWVAQMWTDDCVLSVDDAGFPAPPRLQPQPFEDYGDLTFPMGVTYAYLGDEAGLVFAVSEVGGTGTKKPCAVLWGVDADDQVAVHELEDVSNIPASPNWVCWGMTFNDFDLDGWPDFAAAYGPTGWLTLDDDGAVEVNTHAANRPGGVALWMGGADVWEDSVDRMPEEVEGSSHFGILAGDFYGNDGMGDGCKDLLLTSTPALPTAAHPEVEEQVLYLASAWVLRNRCADDGAAEFVGVRAGYGDVGAIVKLTRSDGHVEYKPILGLEGLTGTVEPSAVFGLPEAVTATQVELLRASGETVVIAPGAQGLKGWLSP